MASRRPDTYFSAAQNAYDQLLAGTRGVGLGGGAIASIATPSPITALPPALGGQTTVSPRGMGSDEETDIGKQAEASPETLGQIGKATRLGSTVASIAGMPELAGPLGVVGRTAGIAKDIQEDNIGGAALKVAGFVGGPGVAALNLVDTLTGGRVSDFLTDAGFAAGRALGITDRYSPGEFVSGRSFGGSETGAGRGTRGADRFAEAEQGEADFGDEDRGIGRGGAGSTPGYE